MMTSMSTKFKPLVKISGKANEAKINVAFNNNHVAIAWYASFFLKSWLLHLSSLGTKKPKVGHHAEVIKALKKLSINPPLEGIKRTGPYNLAMGNATISLSRVIPITVISATIKNSIDRTPYKASVAPINIEPSRTLTMG